MKFKHYKPRRYSKSKLYKNEKYRSFKSLGIKHSELCANCGTSFGHHSGLECPYKEK